VIGPIRYASMSLPMRSVPSCCGSISNVLAVFMLNNRLLAWIPVVSAMKQRRSLFQVVVARWYSGLSGYNFNRLAVFTFIFVKYGLLKPTNLRSAGTTMIWKVTMLDTGLPGRPKTYFFFFLLLVELQMCTVCLVSSKSYQNVPYQ